MWLCNTHRSQEAEGDEFAMLHVDAIASVEVTKAVTLEELNDVLLSLGTVLLHLLCCAGSEHTINIFTSFLTAILRCGCSLIVKRKFDVVVIEHLIHLEEEVNHLGETHVRHSLIDDLTDFTWLHTHIEAYIHIHLELAHGIATNGASKDAHATGLFQHWLLGEFQCLIEGKIIEDLSQFGVTLERVD